MHCALPLLISQPFITGRVNDVLTGSPGQYSVGRQQLIIIDMIDMVVSVDFARDKAVR